MGSRAVRAGMPDAGGGARSGSASRPASSAPPGLAPVVPSSPIRSPRHSSTGPGTQPRQPGSSMRSAARGYCWTPRSCPGARRPVSCCAISTRPSAQRRGPRCRPRSSVLEQAAASGLDVGDLHERTRARAANAAAFTAAYRRYCWPTDGLAGVRIAPFQVLAARGRRLPRTAARLASGDRGPAGGRRSRSS